MKAQRKKPADEHYLVVLSEHKQYGKANIEKRAVKNPRIIFVFVVVLLLWLLDV